MGSPMDMGKFIIIMVPIMKDQLLMDNLLELMAYLSIPMGHIRGDSLTRDVFQVKESLVSSRETLLTKVNGF